MKIVNVNKFYYLRGGAERYFFSLAELLHTHGHDVIPFSMQHPENLRTPYARYFPSYVELGKSEYLNIEILKYLNIVGRIFWSFETAKKFDALLSDTKPDCIHLHNIYHQLSPSLLPVAKRHGIPVVMTVHDYKLIWPDYLLCGYPTSPLPGPAPARPAFGPSPIRRGGYWNVVREHCTHGSYAKSLLVVLEKYFHDWLRVYQKNIDLFLAPSQFVQEQLIAGGYDAKKIRVLPHFVDISTYRNIDISKFRSILYFGRLSKEKGVDILLQMMHTMKSEVELRIAGTGPEGRSYKLQVTSYKLKNVTFLGRLDTTALHKEIDRAAFIVVPSIAPETFGYTILESFARGKPVVASRIGAFSELVDDGKNGLLFAPGDVRALAEKVQYLLTHARERNAMGERALTTAKKYSAQKHYDALQGYYQELL